MPVKVKGEWVQAKLDFGHGHNYRVGGFTVAMTRYNLSQIKGQKNQAYRATLKLPGLNLKTEYAHDESESELMARVEKAVEHWFAKTTKDAEFYDATAES